MTARTRLARWTLPVLLSTGALLLTGCGEQTAGAGGGTTVAEESPTQDPRPSESEESPEPTEPSEPTEPTDEPEPSEPADPSTDGLAGALLPAADVPGFNEEYTWNDGTTSGQEPPELAGTCHEFELGSIGAERVAYRTYEPAQGGGAKASELVAQFPDEMTATRAEDVLLSWRKDCAKKLKKFDRVDVGDRVDVTTDAGPGHWYLLTYGPAEDDPESGYFDAQGVVRVGNRVAVLRLALIGQDYNYVQGEEPMVAAVRAAATRL
jgi:hypothetical protein